MTPEKWQRIKEIFADAVECDPAAREHMLARECRGEPELRAEVDRLLAHHVKDSGFLDNPLLPRVEPEPSELPPVFAVGEVLSGRYKIVQHIGSGGMGEVYRAEDLALAGEIAIKTIRPEISSDVRTLARFKREIQLSRAVTHPNVCRVFDIASCRAASGAETTYLTMELVRGETLASLLQRESPVTWARAVPLLSQMAAALAAAHRAGVIHRDFKPSNVIVSGGLGEELRLVVTDFGLARAIDTPPDREHPTASHTIIGTPAYMAPEQLEGHATTAATDVYAFGLVAYEMLTGQRPFPGPSSFAIALKRLTIPPAPPRTIRPDLDPQWESLILRCLAVDPALRFQNASEVAAQLEGIDWTRPAPKPKGIRWRWPATVVAAMASLGLAVGWVISRPARNAPPFSNADARFVPLTTSRGQELFPTFSPDEKEVVYAGQSSGNWDLYRLKIGERDPVNLTAGSGADNTQPAFSPDGRWIAFRSERDGGGIFLLPANGGKATRISAAGYFPAWSPDSTSIACSTANFTRPARGDIGQSRLLIVDVKTGNQHFPNLNDSPLQPNWSPHGRRIAYWRLRDGRRDVCTAPVEGGSPVCLTSDNHVNWNPVWSPDGGSLYFASDRGGSMNLWRLPLDETSGQAAGEPTPLTTPSAYSGYFGLSRAGNYLAYVQLAQTSHIEKIALDPETRTVAGASEPLTQGLRVTCCPAPSPDGRWVAFGTGAGHEGIYVVRADGTGERLLTMSDHRNRQPHWSPRGEWIAFTSNRGGTSEIWAIRPDGSGLRQVTAEGGLPIVFGGWSPDGRRLYYDVKGSVARVIDFDKPWRQQTPDILPPPDGPNSGFVATNWSADGLRMLGDVYRADGSPGGLAAFSMKTRRYQSLTASGSMGVWLKDGRTLLFERHGRMLLLDSVTGAERELLTIPGGEVEDDFSISPDQHTIYFRLTHIEADIWLVTRQSRGK